MLTANFTRDLKALEATSVSTAKALRALAPAHQHAATTLAKGLGRGLNASVEALFVDLFDAPEKALHTFGLSVTRTLRDMALEAAKVKLLEAVGTMSGGGGAGVSFLKAVLGLRDGGIITGPGGPRGDRIPAMLSAGEAVIPARAVAGNEPLIHALIQGKTPALAMASAGSSPSAAAQARNITPNITPNITINMTGSGTPATDQAAAQTTARAMRKELEALIAQQMAKAMRPGNR